MSDRLKILIVNNTPIPANKYGGTERVIWSLGRALNQRKHEVGFLVKKPSFCDFAKVFFYDQRESLYKQLEDIKKKFDFDLVHVFFNFQEKIPHPHIVTIEGNGTVGEKYPVNAVFVSRNHAERHGSDEFVYNGMAWEDYPRPDFSLSRKGLTFLSDIKRPEKNLIGSLHIAAEVGERLTVMGGWKLSWKRSIRYLGMVDNHVKGHTLNRSNALLFPIRWHEPFGIAVIEAMYYGCPVLATPYGSMPELIHSQTGVIGKRLNDFIEALRNWKDFNFQPETISEYARDRFSANAMTEEYLKYYEKVLNGKSLNPSPPVAKENSDRYNLLPLD